MAKKKKFDTNPLDPEFPEKLREAETAALPKNEFKTAEFPPPAAEEQTRRFSEANFNAYSYQTPPAVYQNPPPAGQAKSRRIDKIGLPENILTALPYLPFSIGLIAGIIELVFVPRSESKVRFHAAQGLAIHIGILIISAILGFVGNIYSFASAGNDIFQIVTLIMLVIWTIKAWQGKPIHIQATDDLTDWLDGKINPRK